MAYTSVIPVYRLDNAVRYAQDKQKTTRQHGMPLAETVDYALNREKTETDGFESGLGCTTQSAYEDMRANAVRWHKTDGVQGYHLVQSFAEGEVTPELAHKIGLELAERVLGGRYQAIVTTHLNTSHYHNHIVWSSVAMNSGTQAAKEAGKISQQCQKLCAGDPRRVGRTVREVRLVDHPNRTRRAGIKALRRMAGREKRSADLAHGDPAGCGCRAGRSADVAAVYTRTGKQGLRAEF